jgi:hypothetical protein
MYLLCVIGRSTAKKKEMIFCEEEIATWLLEEVKKNWN